MVRKSESGDDAYVAKPWRDLSEKEKTLKGGGQRPP